jgi:hypothetical protein
MSENSPLIQPTLQHFGVLTGHLERMVDWYAKVVCMTTRYWVIGSFLGVVFLVIQWMQERQYIQGHIDWNRVGNDTMTWFQSLSTQFSSSHIFGTLRFLFFGTSS